MVTNADARSVLEALVGRQIRTVTGRPNTVMVFAPGCRLIRQGLRLLVLFWTFFDRVVGET